MLMVLIAIALPSLLLAVLFIALCAHADDRKRERREEKERSGSSSEQPVYDDRLEDFSDNADFHVNAKSNKELRQERAAKPAPPRRHSSSSSDSKGRP
jgi:hypothetical protein